MPRGPRVVLGPLLLGVAGLLACRSAPPPPPPLVGPPVEVEVRAFEGSPLGGGAGRVEIAADEADFDSVVARVLALEAPVTDVLTSASVAARLVTPLEGEGLLLPTGVQTRGVRFTADAAEVDAFEEDLDAGELGRTAEIGVARAALTRRTTVAFRLEAEDARVTPARLGGVRELVEVLVHRRDDGGLECGLAVRGLRTPDGEDALPGVRREMALFPMTEESGAGAAAFVLPSPFEGGGAALAFLVRVRSPDEDEEDRAAHEAAVAALLEDLGAARRAEAPPPAPLPLWPGAREALSGLQRPDQQRSALAYLAGRAGAAVAEEVALTGSDAIVDRVSRAILAELDEAGVPLFGEALTWLLELAAYEQLVDDARRGVTVAEAVLVRHAGELGRFPDVLAQAVRAARGDDDLDRRLVAENRAYLTDLDPAARVRAYDWLVARGEAPAGYDPLGPREARRDAIRRASPPETGGTESEEPEDGDDRKEDADA